MQRELVAGDHIKVSRGPYHHHGLYVGDGWALHLSGIQRKSAACVDFVTLAAFASPANVAAIEVVDYALCSPVAEVFARAHQQHRRRGYDLFQDNCEHFARWCKTGEHRSEQVETKLAVAGGLAGGAGATAAAVSVVSASGAVAGMSGPGIMSGLATVGGAVGGGAAAGVTVLAAAPAVLATVAAHRAFRDDVALPAAERDARRVARQSSVVGAAAGTVGTIAAISASGSVAGLSAAGITSGLAAIGGTMGGGVLMVIAAPAIAAGAVGWVAYRLAKARRRGAAS